VTWLHTHRLSLTALMFCVVAVAGVHLWLDVMPIADRQKETITVVDDGTAELAGQEVTLEDARWDEYPAPDRARVVSVHMRGSGGPESTSCGRVTLSEVQGSRTWLDADDVIDVPYEAGQSYCTEESEPYDITSVFLVPDDVEGPFFLDIAGDDHTITRFLVEP